jgi:hypothetical protein
VITPATPAAPKQDSVITVAPLAAPKQDSVITVALVIAVNQAGGRPQATFRDDGPVRDHGNSGE